MDTHSRITHSLADYLTVAEAARKLKIGTRAVQTACARGLLPGAFRLGRSWFIPPSAVEDRKKQYGRGPIPQKKRVKKKILTPTATTTYDESGK